MPAIPAQRNPWFIRFAPPSQPRVRLFCFHHGGGSALGFRNWPQYLPAFVEVVGVQLPGRETRYAEAPIGDLSTVVGAITEQIASYLDVPHVFFGYSVGALIAHHVADRLREAGSRPLDHLIVAGRSAPSDATVYYESIAHLSDAQFLSRLREYEGTPEEFVQNAQLTRIYLPILRSDFTLSETVAAPCRQLACPISAFGGMNDRMPEERLRLWQKETTAACDVRMFPGGHFFVREQEAAVVGVIGGSLRARYSSLAGPLWV